MDNFKGLNMSSARFSDLAIIIPANNVDLFSVEPVIMGLSGQSLQLSMNSSQAQDGFAADYIFNGGGIEVRVKLDTASAIRVEATVTAQAELQISKFGLRFHYLPDASSKWTGCRESFHWLPNIKSQENCIAGDHVFRSPAAILTSPDSEGVAVVPDLDLLAKCRPSPQYLDMGFPENRPPWTELGFTPQKITGHVYYMPSGDMFNIPPQGISLAAWVIHGPCEVFPGAATAFLWERFGRRFACGGKPQIMPFRRYAEYGYPPAIKHLWRPGPTPGTGGITLSTFRRPDGAWSGRAYADDLWFHSWFNNARTAWGMAEWGRHLNRPDWVEKSHQIMKLALSAPREKGIFPAVYAPHDGGWKCSGNESGGTALYHLPDAAWTGIWIRKYHSEIQMLPEAPKQLAALSEFLIGAQAEDGGFPTWVKRVSLKPDSRLNGAACGALALWFLGEELLSGNVSDVKKPAFLKTIVKGASYLRTAVLPHLKFEDFELYFSCSRKEPGFYDPWTHSFGVNTLAVQWCAEAFRVAYLLGAGEEKNRNLFAGRFCIDLMCLFQQVWPPPYLTLYAFGGFGVMNTDGEWNDARQAQFAETLANWHELTGEKEYRERAVAAARASLALMVCEENREICPNNYKGAELQFETHGMMAENYAHCGVDKRSYQSGFHWGTGSALTTVARLLRRGILSGFNE